MKKDVMMQTEFFVSDVHWFEDVEIVKCISDMKITSTYSDISDRNEEIIFMFTGSQLTLFYLC